MYSSPKTNNLLGFFIFLSSALLGYSFYTSVTSYKETERSVTVKGLAEKEVQANLAIWPITFYENSHNLNQLRQQITKNAQNVKNFLLKNGFSEKEFFSSAPKFKDRYAHDYVDVKSIRYRYHAQIIITVKTKDIFKVIKAKKLTGELQQQGVFLDYDTYENQTRFIYTNLNTIKPEMIKTSTINARNTAMQFAKDSQSQLGKIKRASQGLFSINNIDDTTPHIKKVRVVTTVTYYLNN